MRNSSRFDSRKFEPSFGFSTINEEMKGLFEKLDVSSFKLANHNPPFMFGRLKNDPQCDQFVKELENCQEKINQLLTSDHFLEKVLHRIVPNEKIDFPRKLPSLLSISNSDIKKLPFLVAAGIWNDIKEENQDFQQAYLLGCQDCNSGLPLQKDSKDPFRYQELRAFSKIQQKLDATNQFFDQLDLDRNYLCFEPKQLYIRTLEEGIGEILSNQGAITSRYIFKSPDEQVWSDTFNSLPTQIHLKETIPGFAKGVKGMSIGEIRQILIHPNLAYGVFTTAEKGVYLNCKVQLINIDNDSEKLGEHQIFQDVKIPAISASELAIESKRVGYRSGDRAWQHYKKSPYYSLKQVLAELETLEKGKEFDISDELSQNLFNRLHWNLYQ